MLFSNKRQPTSNRERERDKEAIDLIIGTKEEKISTNNFHDNEIIILQAMKFRLTEM